MVIIECFTHPTIFYVQRFNNYITEVGWLVLKTEMKLQSDKLCVLQPDVQKCVSIRQSPRELYWKLFSALAAGVTTEGM